MWSVSLVRPVALTLAVLMALSSPLAALDSVPAYDPATAGPPAPASPSDDGPPQDAPLVTGALNERELFTDPEGDIEIQYLGDNPIPAQDADAPIDIVSLRAAETDQGLLFSLKHRGYPEGEATRSGVSFSEARCDIDFQIAGEEGVRFGVQLDYLHQMGGSYDAFGFLYMYEDDEDDEDDQRPSFFDREYLGNVPVALVANDHFDLLVEKDLLAIARDEPLKTGERLEGFAVECSRNSGTFFVRFADSATADPKTGIYPITMATSTAEIALALPEDARRSVAVATSQTSKVTLDVENLVGRKLLVNLTASVVGSDGAPLPGWVVKSAPTLELKSEGTVPASIIVSVDPSVAHRTSGTLKLVAFPLGFEDKATFTVQVYAVTPLGPDHNTLRFHRADPGSYYCYGICFSSEDIPLSDSKPDYFVLNVLDQDPVYGAEEGEDDGIAIFSTDYMFAELDAPLAAPVRFDPDGFIDVTVALRSGVARDVGFVLNIWSTADGYLGYMEGELAVSENVQDHTLTIPVNQNLLDLPTGTRIGLSMEFHEADGGLSGDTWISSVEWAPARSSMTLPLVALPHAQVNVTDGRALPTVALGNATEREEYVNPGEGQAFDLILVNEGTEDDVLRVTTTASAPGWKVDFDPGNRFSLKPGASAPLCMTVTAPKDAVEGDVVNITLTAASKLDAQVRTEIDLTLLVTTGVDIEPSSCKEIAEEDYVAPLPDKTEESPAPASLVALALAGLVVAVMRRRP